MRTLFIDVDTQHDFCHPSGALFVKGSDALLPAFARLTEHALAHGHLIVGSVDSHAFDAWEFAGAPEPGPDGARPNFPPHCVKGTAGWLKVPGSSAGKMRFVPNVPLDDAALRDIATRHAPQQLLLEKEVYSLFANPNADALLDIALEGHDDARFVVYGVALDYCVRAAALGLVDYLARRGRKGEVLLCTDATASVVAEGGASALDECKAKGVRAVSTDQALSLA